MGNKLYDENSIKAIAEAIRSKNGRNSKYKVGEMAEAVNSIETGAEPVSITWHQCPELPRDFVDNVTYDPNDYSVSKIENYAPETPSSDNYTPIAITIDGDIFYNEVPNIETPFQTSESYGTVKPLDKVRFIGTPSAPNVRDIGGWSCDGGTVKYGLLFRGGYVSEEDRDVLVGELGIRHDLDLRGKSSMTEYSPLGNDVYYTCAPNINWYSLANTDDWAINLRCVFDAVTHNEPVYFHCSAGADRTATLACVLEGLLGMSQSDIDKEYELTCFYTGTDSDENARRRNEGEWGELIGALNKKNGDTFTDKCVSFVTEIGFTEDEINDYRKAMIDGNPGDVSANVSEFTITRTLSNVVSDNSVTTARQYQSYEANITPISGNIISEVKITMGGTDITSQAWNGSETIFRYNVTLSIENATSSNTSTSVVGGESYATQLTADDSYTLDGATITITMGDKDMSKYYSNGTIAIPSVTGNLVITVKAVESASQGGDDGDNTEQYVNLIPTSVEPGTTTIYGTNGYIDGTRYNSSGKAVTTETAGNDGVKRFTTGVITVPAVGTKFRLLNCWINSTDADGFSPGGANSWTFKDSTPSYSVFSGSDFADGTWQNASLVTDVIYSDNGRVIGFATAQYMNNVAFTLASYDASEAVVYIEN